MSDLVVTVPQRQWVEWVEEGDDALGGIHAGTAAPWNGEHEYGFNIGGRRPPLIRPGERVYIVAYGRLRGYSPLLYIAAPPEPERRFGARPGSYALVRRGDAVACTIPVEVPGFQGVRRRWWNSETEVPFPNWRSEGLPEGLVLP